MAIFVAMSSLTMDIDRVMQSLDAPRASRLERLLRDGLALALPDDQAALTPGSQEARHQAWLRRLENLRGSLGTGGQGTSTEAIIDELRAGRE